MRGNGLNRNTASSIILVSIGLLFLVFGFIIFQIKSQNSDVEVTMNIVPKEIETVITDAQDLAEVNVANEGSEKEHTTSLDFGLDGSDEKSQNEALKSMFTSDEEVIYLLAGKYIISDTLIINDGVPKKIIGEAGTIIVGNLPKGKNLLETSVNISFYNITFDFEQGNVRTGLLYSENLGNIVLKNIYFKNVSDMDSTTSTSLINIPTEGNTVELEEIYFNRIYKLGNNNIEDAAGNVTAIYFSDRGSKVGANGTIKKINITEMHNIDETGAILFEDTSGIYISSKYEGEDSFLAIESVTGVNSGKRLIKIDASNLSINSIVSENSTSDQLCAIGINAEQSTSSNITISDVIITGYANFGIAIYGNDIELSEIDIQLKKNTWTDVFGIVIGGTNINIHDFDIRAGRCFFFNSKTKIIENIHIYDGSLTVQEYGTHAIHYKETSHGFRKVIIENLTAKYLARNSIGISFFSAIGLDGSDEGKGEVLTINDCTFDSVAEKETIVNVNFVEGININNFHYVNKVSKSGISLFEITNSSNFNISDIVCDADIFHVITLLDSHDGIIKDVKSRNPELVVYMENSDNIKVDNINMGIK